MSNALCTGGSLDAVKPISDLQPGALVRSLPDPVWEEGDSGGHLSHELPTTHGVVLQAGSNGVAIAWLNGAWQDGEQQYGTVSVLKPEQFEPIR